MINRRDLIVGGACVAAAASAEAMRPKTRVALLPAGAELEAAIPKSFGKWKEHDTGGVVAPQEENSLAAKLYNQTVARTYADPEGNYVMLLIAYGNTQSDTLQLHRPEVCYPAFGFTVIENQAAALPLGRGQSLTGRNLIAEQPGRQEFISYWTRIGEFMPTDNSEQRQMRFRTALAGVIPDGVLVRISNVMSEEGDRFVFNGRFVQDLIQALPKAVLPALITTEKARAFTGLRQA